MSEHFPPATQKILVALTTYAGDFESRLILRKVVAHLRAKNGNQIFLLVVSDGPVVDQRIHQIADAVLERPGPCGLHQGELDSIWQIINFAQELGFTRIIKSAGDIIMTVPNWAQVVMKRFEQTSAKLMSTHWFEDDSWIVGTKFFVAKTDFLAQTLPKRIDRSNLEEAFTASISARYSLKEVAYLINSNTGERDEVTHELNDWGWEHAHRLSKFVCLDEFASAAHRCFSQLLFYPALRAQRDIRRSFKKLQKK